MVREIAMEKKNIGSRSESGECCCGPSQLYRGGQERPLGEVRSE